MEYENEPTLHDLFGLLRRGIVPAVLVMIVLGATAYVLSSRQTPVYEAQATVLTSAQDPNQRDFGTTLVTAPPLDISSYRVAATSRPVLAAAYSRLTGSAPDESQLREFARAITVRTEDAYASSIMRLSVRDEDPARARDLANALAESVVAWDAQRATRALETILESLQAQIEAIDAELAVAATDDDLTVDTVTGLERARAEMTLQLSSARALRTAAVGRIELMEPAATPNEPVSPNPLRNAVLLAAFGVLIVYGGLLLRDVLDTRVGTVDDLARVTGLPVLAEFPSVNGGRRSLPREPTSYLRTSVDFATADAHPKIVLITSTHSGHGKSSVAMALAESYARQVHKVLLLDADLRKPVIANEYALASSSAMTMSAALADPERVAPTHVHIARDTSIDVIANFEPAPDPTELLSQGIRPLLNRMAGDYDVIVIDSAPILPVVDALTVAPHSTGVLLAVSLPDADRRSVASATGLLRRLNVRMIGAIATNLPQEAGRSAKGYGYGYGYGYGGAQGMATAHGSRTRGRRRS